MEKINLILSYITYAGGCLAFLLALQQITARKRKRRNVFRFFHLTHESILFIQIGLIANFIPLQYPVTAFPFFTLCLILGPSNLLINKLMLDPEAPISSGEIVHYIPSLLAFIFEIIFQLKHTTLGKIQIFLNFLEHPWSSSIAFLFLFVVAHALVYLLINMKNELNFWNNNEIKVEARSIGIMNMLGIFGVICFVSGFYTGNSTLMLLCTFFIYFAMFSLFILQDYYPEFFLSLNRNMHIKKYERSQLRGKNTDIIKKRLEEIMEVEELYKEMELNLTHLAEKVNLTPHQLSQFLNEHMNMNFRNFINLYRIREAKRLILQKYSMNITEICYAVGFNSKTPFNIAFKEITGKTPREFREESVVDIIETEFYSL